MTTRIHDSATCSEGPDNQPCDMCQFAQNARRTISGLFRAEQGEKIDSSPSSASGIDISAPTFDQEWRDAPKWTTRTTEEVAAEYWFIRGQHAKEVELVTLLNLDLTEMVRVARERVER